MMQQQVPVAADVIRKKDKYHPTQGEHGVGGSGRQMKSRQKVYRGKTCRLMGWQFDIRSKLFVLTSKWRVRRSARNACLF